MLEKNPTPESQQLYSYVSVDLQVFLIQVFRRVNQMVRQVR